MIRLHYKIEVGTCDNVQTAIALLIQRSKLVCKAFYTLHPLLTVFINTEWVRRGQMVATKLPMFGELECVIILHVHNIIHIIINVYARMN